MPWIIENGVATNRPAPAEEKVVNPSATPQPPGGSPGPDPGPGGLPAAPAPAAPAPGNLPTDFQGAAGQVLSGYFLDQGNPHLQSGVLDPMRREAQQTYDQQRASLDEAALQGGGAAYGGDMYQNLAARMYGAHQQQVGEQQNAVLANQHNLERGHMMTALGLQSQFENAGLDRASQEMMSAAQNATSINIANIGAATQIQAAQIAAETQRRASASANGTQLEIANLQAQLSRDLQGGQLDFSRQQLALDAMNSLSRNNLAEASFLAALAGQQSAQDATMMGVMGNIGTQWGNQQLQGYGQQANVYGQQLGGYGQQLGGYGQAPGLEQAGYYGAQQAFGAEQTVNAQDAAAAAQRAAIINANRQAAWEYDRYNGQGAFDAYLRQVMGIGSMGGSSSTTGTGAQGPQQNPWLAGVGQGLATYGALGGQLGGGQPPPAGGAAPAAGVPPGGAPGPGWRA